MSRRLDVALERVPHDISLRPISRVGSHPDLRYRGVPYHRRNVATSAPVKKIRQCFSKDTHTKENGL